MSDLLSITCKAILITCSSDATKETRDSANHHIESLFGADEGWLIGRQLLSGQLPNVHESQVAQMQFMGAHILFKKLSAQLVKVAVESEFLKATADFLIDQVISLATRNAPRFVIVKTLNCASLVAILLVIDSSWSNPVYEVTTRLQNASAVLPPSDVALVGGYISIYHKMQAETAKEVLLSDPKMIQLVEASMVSGSAVVLRLLDERLFGSSVSDPDSLKDYLDCLVVWIKHYFPTETIRETLFQLLSYTSRNEFSESLMLVCFETFRSLIDVAMHRNFGKLLCELVLKNASVFRVVQKAAIDKDDELASAGALFFGSLLESFPSFFVDNWLESTVQNFLLFVLELTSISGAPGSEQDAMEVLVNGWVSLCDELTMCDLSLIPETSFVSLYKQVTAVLLSKICYPASPGVFESFDSDSKQQLLHLRREIKNAICDFVPLLKAELVQFMALTVCNASESSSTDFAQCWPRLEAVLYVIYGLAPSLTAIDAPLVDAIFSNVPKSPFSMISAHAEQCPAPLVNSLLLVINGLADWMSQKEHEVLFMLVLPFTVRSWRRLETAQYGGEALKSFAELAKSNFTVELVQTLFQEYQACQKVLEPSCQKVILPVLFSLVDILGTERMIEFLSNVFADFGTILRQCKSPLEIQEQLDLFTKSVEGLEKSSASLEQKLHELKLLGLSIGSLDMFSAIENRENVRCLLVKTEEQLWQTIGYATQMICEFDNDRELFFDLISSFVSRLLKLYQFPVLIPFLQKVLAWTESGFIQTGFSCFWGVVQVLVQVYVEPNELTKYCMAFFGSTDAPTVTVRDFQRVLCAMAQHLSVLPESPTDNLNGQLILLNEIVSKKFEFFVEWLGAPDTGDVLQSYLLAEFIPKCITVPDRLTNNLAVQLASNLFKQNVRLLLENIASRYIYQIIYGIGQACPRSLAGDLSLPLFTIIGNYPEKARAGLEHCLAINNFPTKFVGMEEKKKFISQIMTTRKLSQFKVIVKSFGILCRGGTTFVS